MKFTQEIVSKLKKHYIYMPMANETTYHYDIFKTQWGWFGLLGCEKGLLRTHLPATYKEVVERRLLEGIPDAQRNKRAFSALKKALISYYKGRPVDFKEIQVCLDGFTDFQQNVLTRLRDVSYGKTVTYSDLARFCGNPRASRAIGAVMAANPLPLVIPCHRVIKVDGTCGRFSAPGGTNTKKRMLKLENKST